MPSQQTSSQHLNAARQLLDELALDRTADPQVKATAALAHATLVVAEQVAVARVVMATDAAESMAIQH
jgi:hypothetical protein